MTTSVTVSMHDSRKSENSNILILLHGMGDNQVNFLEFGKKLELPQTLVVSVQGTVPLAPLLGESESGDKSGYDVNKFGYAWYLEEEWGVDRNGFQDSLQGTIDRLVAWLHSDIFIKFSPERVFLFGYGQGGSCSVQVAKSLAVRLGGVVSVSGPPLGALNDHNAANDHNSENNVKSSSGINCCKSDILLTTTCKNQSAALETLDHTSTAGYGSYQIYAVPGKTSIAMPSSPLEVKEIMKFLSKRLHLRNFALEATADRVVNIEKI